MGSSEPAHRNQEAVELTVRFEWPFHPSDVIVGREYGPIVDRSVEEPTLHDGIDLCAPAGSLVRAAGDGVVTLVLLDRHGDDGEGNAVWIKHSDELTTKVRHLAGAPQVSLGETVRLGQVLGTVGQTGNATGPHVCFSTIYRGRAINPRTFMRDAAGPIPERD